MRGVTNCPKRPFWLVFMKKIDRQSRTFFIQLWMTVALFLCVIVAFAFYLRAGDRLEQAYQERIAALTLANELRQSSDDLTRMVRTYVVTLNPVYKQRMQEIMDIRDGKRNRPLEYGTIYWDLILEDDKRPAASGDKIPLLELLRRTGVTEAEFAKLNESKQNSDRLTKTEFLAMQLAEASPLAADPSHAQAIHMLYDHAYHQAKAEIMGPLRDFETMLELRTKGKINQLEEHQTYVRWLLLLTGMFLVASIWNASRSLRVILGSSPGEVNERIELLGRGDFSAPIVAGQHGENSVMGKLLEAQRRLQLLDTRRSKSEMKLRVSRQRFVDIANVSGDWIWETDTSFCFVYASEGAQSQFGYLAQELLGKTLFDLIPPEKAEKSARALGFMLTRKSAFRDFEMTLLDRQGRAREILCSGNVVVDDAGQFSGYRGVIRDISDDRRVAAAAFESGEGMVITDRDGNILRANQAFLENSGYSLEELPQRRLGLAESASLDEDFYQAMWAKLEETGSWQGELMDRRKNGECYPKWLSVSAVKGSDGSVTHYICTHFDLTERRLAEEKILELAYYDQLTGLPNRTLFFDRLKQAMAATSRSGMYGALFFIDLDNFKMINDTLGHAVGDELLKMVGERLLSSIRCEDTIARLGGDEFVLIAQNLGNVEHQAAHLAEVIGEKIGQQLNQPYLLAGASCHSTPSIGVSLFCGEDTSLEKLMKQADMAMYRAKTSGRNATRFFDPAMEAYVTRRAALEKDLREALEERQFVLHYQPQVGQNGRVEGCEALVRWRHPERGMVSPADFIPLAEETGLILPLGRWVLENACQQLASWAQQPELAELSVSVNVSVRQFHEKHFVSNVLSALRKIGADPQKLWLELTESLMVDRVDEIIEKMLALKSMGIRFSLDDFGTGYSSLINLKHLPLDELKIDCSFVRELPENENAASIVSSILAMGKSLGIGVVAEGVETVQQRDFLAKAGCFAYQGYLFSRPLPVDDFVDFIRRSPGG